MAGRNRSVPRRATGEGFARLDRNGRPTLHETVRRFVSGYAARALVCAGVLSSALAGCNESKGTPPPPPPPKISSIEAFGNTPTVDTWEELHDEIVVAGAITPDDESRIVRILASKDVPANVRTAMAIDLATYDWDGTLHWVRLMNIGAKSDPSDGPAAIARTADLAWLMLSLRAGVSNEAVDLSGMNLRSRSAIVGQAMNLDNVDFSGTNLPDGVWRRAVLTDSKWGGAVAGDLRCDGCSWGTISGNAVLLGGRWVTH
jgi:hypothetical protein